VSSQLALEGAVEDGGEQGVEFGGGLGFPYFFIETFRTYCGCVSDFGRRSLR
jgi:hypothetical protein